MSKAYFRFNFVANILFWKLFYCNYFLKKEQLKTLKIEPTAWLINSTHIMLKKLINMYNYAICLFIYFWMINIYYINLNWNNVSIKVDGKLTLGENIADNGAIKVSFKVNLSRVKEKAFIIIIIIWIRPMKNSYKRMVKSLYYPTLFLTKNNCFS